MVAIKALTVGVIQSYLNFNLEPLGILHTPKTYPLKELLPYICQKYHRLKVLIPPPILEKKRQQIKHPWPLLLPF